MFDENSSCVSFRTACHVSRREPVQPTVILMYQEGDATHAGLTCMFGMFGIGAHLAPSPVLITEATLRFRPGNARPSPELTGRPCVARLHRC